MATAPRILTDTGWVRPSLGPLITLLVDGGVLDQADGFSAETIAQRQDLPTADVLISKFEVAHFTIAQAYSTLYQARFVNPCELPPDASLLDTYGAANAIRTGVLPWRMMGGQIVVLTDKPDQFDRQTADMSATFGPLRMAVTSRDYLEKSVAAMRRTELSKAAETKVTATQSSRTWNAKRAGWIGVSALITLILCAVFAPTATIAAIYGWTISILILSTLLKAVAAIVHTRSSKNKTATHTLQARLPKITVLIPLFKETAIAQHLLAQLSDLNYPRELRDVCLVAESGDITTREALGDTVLPTWMRPVIFPHGTLRTKPQALNYALDFAQGTIISVYDAEDAPAPDQLRQIAQRFAERGPEVACLQGVLDYYNDSAKWLTRCFNIEYASWFRMLLPGMEKLGLVVPLGGTTLFFRRNTLEELGGWDAHNVTEDADLDVRLPRAGYRTELINTVTQEEANGRFWPWIK